MKKVVVLSSFVAPDNRSPVGVNYKFLTLCRECFDEVVFITSNYPEEALHDFAGEHFTLENIPLNWNISGGKASLINYVKMQLKAIPLMKKHCTKGAQVMFWLAGPMILPFWYSKLKRMEQWCFLYGNSKLRSEKFSPYDSLIALLTKHMARHARHTGVEAPSVLAQWGQGFEKKMVQEVSLYSDTDRFSPQIPYAQRGNTIGMSGRLTTNKKILESIEAFHLLREEFPDWHLEIVGSGKLAQEAAALVEKLGEQTRITLCGWVDYSQINTFYDRWKLLLFPSTYEGLPNVLVEAMCCGTPALASPVGGVPDCIANGKTGWLLQNTTPLGIAEQLREVLKDPQREQIAQAAQRFAVEKYCYESRLENFKKVVGV